MTESNKTPLNLSKIHLHWGEFRYRGEKYRSYSLARTVRINGKNRKQIIVKLGKLNPIEEQRWREMLQAARGHGAITNLDNVCCEFHYDYLDVAVLLSIWNEWGLDRCFPGKGKRSIDVADIAKILTFNRSIEPSSKFQVPIWFRETALAFLLDIPSSKVNTSRIYRELEVIENSKSALCNIIFTTLKGNKPESLTTVFYDLSTTTFSTDHCSLVKWGRAKEGYTYHATLALVLNQEGFPFYWEVLPGGTSDVKTIEWLLKELKQRFSVSDVTLVFDRGMVSEKNLSLIEVAKIKYITALDKSQIESVAKFDFRALAHTTSDNIIEKLKSLGFIESNDTTFLLELDSEDEHKRFILGFNPTLYVEQRKQREKAIQEFLKFAETLNFTLAEAVNNRARTITYKKFKDEIEKQNLQDFVDVKLELVYVRRKIEDLEYRSRSFQGTVLIDEQKKQLASRLDGFWVIVTNQTTIRQNHYKKSPAEIVQAYREKSLVEHSFRDIKSFIEIAPVYLWTEKHVKAHYTICVLAHLLNKTLAQKLKFSPSKKLTKEIISHERLLRELRSCKLNKLSLKGQFASSTFSLSALSDVQHDLLSRLSLMHLAKLPNIHNFNKLATPAPQSNKN